MINSIETKIFRPSDVKHRLISYMPRKNAKDSAVVSSLLRQQSWFEESGWSRTINGLSQEKVSKILQNSLIFLAFGHPEGFGLPLAEAAACGCYVIIILDLVAESSFS